MEVYLQEMQFVHLNIQRAAPNLRVCQFVHLSVPLYEILCQKNQRLWMRRDKEVIKERPDAFKGIFWLLCRVGIVRHSSPQTFITP